MNSAGAPHTQAAGPFGYSFSYTNEPSTDTQDMPASTGPTLLNSHEDDYINNFFLTQQNHDMAGPDFNMAMHHAQEQLHGHNLTQFGWLMTEPPPTFMGTSGPKPAASAYQNMQHPDGFDFNAAFSGGNHVIDGHMHQNMLAHGGLSMQNSMHHVPPHPLHTPSLVSAPSTEASDLLHSAGAESMSSMAGATSSLMMMQPTTATAHDHSLMGGHSNLSSIETRQNMRNDGPHTAPARMDDLADSRLYRFGSDTFFGSHGFKPPSLNESHDVIGDRLTHELRMMKPINRSNTATRAPSPSRRKTMPDHIVRSQPGDDDEDHSNRPRKRRKDEDGDLSESPGVPGKRKISTPTNQRLRRVSGTDETSSAKRRRSSMSGAKLPRENLSEEQKRSNHIQSEQKRRNLIKQGFDELRTLVPELRGGGLSKSMELMEVCNFLEQVINANKAMKRRLGIVDTG